MRIEIDIDYSEDHENLRVYSSQDEIFADGQPITQIDKVVELLDKTYFKARRALLATKEGDVLTDEERERMFKKIEEEGFGE